MTFQHRLTKLQITSFLLLVILLFSAITHSHEFTLEGQLLEQVDCKLCQQLVDPPKNKVKLAKITLGIFSADSDITATCCSMASQYFSKSPRAPPIFT